MMIAFILLLLALPRTTLLAQGNTGEYIVFEGKNVSLRVHKDVDLWVKENNKNILAILDNNVERIFSILGLSKERINVTIVPMELGAKLGIRYEPFLITDNGVIIAYAPLKARGAQVLSLDNESLMSMGYLLGWVIDAIDIYFILNNIGYWYSDASFGLMEALKMVNTIPQGYLVLKKTLKYPHGFTASMINIGYYKPISKAIFEYRVHARSYAWEVDSFGYWLIEKYGVNRFIELYRLIAQNPNEQLFEKIYGKDLNELENEWLSYLKEKYNGTVFTKNTVAVFSTKNLVVIYDEPLEDVAKSSKDILTKMSFNLFELRPNVTLYSSVQIGSTLENVLENNDVLIITITSSKVFNEVIKLSKVNIGACNHGFVFLSKCYTSNNDVLFIVEPNKYDNLIRLTHE